MKSFKRGFSNPSSTSVLFLGWLGLAVLLAVPSAYPQAQPTISVQLSNGYARLTVTGDIGSACTLQSVTNLTQNWQFLTNLTLSATETTIVDSTAPLPTQRFYRVYSQQVPTNIVMTNLVWISPGTFLMGSPTNEAERYPNEGPPTQVTLSHGFWMGKFHVTQGEYAALMGNNPSYFTTNDVVGRPISPDLSRPVEQVTWNDAVAYCAEMNTREGNAGRLPAGYVYRLPTEAEWEYACRAGTTTAFHYGPALRSGMANFADVYEYDASVGTIFNPYFILLGRTTSVGGYEPNAWGLYDMHGNVFTWCQDWYLTNLAGGSLTDPTGPNAGSDRVFRGGSLLSQAVDCRSAFRGFNIPDYQSLDLGFRVVLAPVQTSPNMVYIPPGTFTMGSPDTEAERSTNEGPLTLVTISHAFWMGKFDVTQGEYASLMATNPSYFNGDRSGPPSYGQDYGTDLSRPVEQVSWNDAVAYCAAVTSRERTAGRLPAGYVYRLPTEAEWEYACRAGTTTAFHYGPALRSGMANFYGYYEYDASSGTTYNASGTYLGRTTPVGSYAPNAWGLYDMHGNLWQWCQDWWDGTGGYPGGSVTDPQGAATGSYRVMRGGYWNNDAGFCRSAFRNDFDPDFTFYFIGFRVVLAPSLP